MDKIICSEYWIILKILSLTIQSYHNFGYKNGHSKVLRKVLPRATLLVETTWEGANLEKMLTKVTDVQTVKFDDEFIDIERLHKIVKYEV